MPGKKRPAYMRCAVRRRTSFTTYVSRSCDPGTPNRFPSCFSGSWGQNEQLMRACLS